MATPPAPGQGEGELKTPTTKLFNKVLGPRTGLSSTKFHTKKQKQTEKKPKAKEGITRYFAKEVCKLLVQSGKC